MAKSDFQKKKQKKKKTEPPHRTPDYFKKKTNLGKLTNVSKFSKGVGRSPSPNIKFNPASFKVQHKG